MHWYIKHAADVCSRRNTVLRRTSHRPPEHCGHTEDAVSCTPRPMIQQCSIYFQNTNRRRKKTPIHMDYKSHNER